MSLNQVIRTVALGGFAVLAFWPAPAAGESSAVLQYSGQSPAVGAAGPGAPVPPPPTVPRELFAAVPESEVYTLAQVAISSELGGSAGISGLTHPPFEGAGRFYSPADESAPGAAADALLDRDVLAVLVPALILAAALSLRGPMRRRLAPG